LPLADKEWYFYFTMVDQLAPTETCKACGALLIKDQFEVEGLCGVCAEVRLGASGEGLNADAAFAPLDSVPPSQEPVTPDPDNPHWGPASGVGVWVASVAAIIVIPIIAVIAWYLIQSARGAQLPNLSVAEEMLAWLKSPTLLLVQVLSTIVAHAITLVICWVVVTRFGKRQFWASLGWNWAGRSVWYWLAFSACVIVALLIATQLLSRVLPQSEENSFTELLKSSKQVRIAIAVLATFSAPLVEEAVYRGILYSGLRRSFGLNATVALVTLMFAGVHVLQYLGAWVSIAGLTLLSLALTIVRARTKSILPCVAIHTVNNGFFSVLIVLNIAT
jgi:membrane protease YdiL (CAAX protease family)